MTTTYIAPAVGGWIVVESCAQRSICSAFKYRCVQAGEMTGGQFRRVVAGSAEHVFLLNMISMPTRVVAVVLTGSPHMAAQAVVVRVEGSRHPIRGCLTTMAANVRALPGG